MPDRHRGEDGALLAHVLEDTHREEEQEHVSGSYPGLVSVYRMHHVRCRVEGLPEEGFETREEREGGFLVTRWEWRGEGEGEKRVGE